MGVRNIGDVPITVLSGGRFDLSPDLPVEPKRRLVEDRHRALVEYIGLSSGGGTFVALPEAGHDVASDAPIEVVSHIRALLRQAANPLLNLPDQAQREMSFCPRTLKP